MSDNQSVKDILEDIKKAISGKNPSGDKAEVIDDDVLCLEEEYPEDIEEKENSEEENNCQSEKMNNQFNSYNSEEKNLYDNIQMSSNKVSYQEQSNEHLVLKENMEEIKTLLEKMQSELRHKQQKRADLTVEELVVSLLKPQLSEWLNKYLHALVKEVVEKELKDIINNK
ncbi:PopZ family protein [Wolbachia endosymbiont (group B) of Villa cingulata]|uniref:PopZ family protein n=1 Tax=Wolbachia endosymbiont (group B) of Villa cingulata TaxID=3066157 RepID=UPI0033409242